MSILLLSKYKNTSYTNKRLIETFENNGLNIDLRNPNEFDVFVNKGKGLRYQGKTFETPKAVLIRTGSATSDFMTSVIRQFEEEDVKWYDSYGEVVEFGEFVHNFNHLSTESTTYPSLTQNCARSLTGVCRSDARAGTGGA